MSDYDNRHLAFPVFFECKLPSRKCVKFAPTGQPLPVKINLSHSRRGIMTVKLHGTAINKRILEISPLPFVAVLKKMLITIWGKKSHVEQNS